LLCWLLCKNEKYSKSKTTMMLDLPLEILERIFSQLPPIDLIRLSSSIPQIKEYVESKVKPINTQREYMQLCRKNDELSVLYANKPMYFNNTCLKFACDEGFMHVGILR
jgi:hypothetical protein